MRNILIERLDKNGDLPQAGTGLDVGFGTGEDILFLNSRGLKIIGVEKNENLYNSFLEKIHSKENIVVLNQEVESYQPQKNSFDIVILNNVLPFLNKENSKQVIQKSVNALKKGGYALLTLFGPKDEWSNKSDMSFFEYHEATSFLEQFDVNIYFKSSEEGVGLTKKGEKKYWHIHRFILERR